MDDRVGAHSNIRERSGRISPTHYFSPTLRAGTSRQNAGNSREIGAGGRACVVGRVRSPPARMGGDEISRECHPGPTNVERRSRIAVLLSLANMTHKTCASGSDVAISLSSLTVSDNSSRDTHLGGLCIVILFRILTRHAAGRLLHPSDRDNIRLPRTKQGPPAIRDAIYTEPV